MTFDSYGYHDAYDSAHQRVTETQPDMAAYGPGGFQAPWNTASTP
jgi:hypothetical protein